MSVCHKSHYFQVAISWIADDDDIYIMVECIMSEIIEFHKNGA